MWMDFLDEWDGSSEVCSAVREFPITCCAAFREQVERLTPALLSKAFRGELVAQDPGDEPASVLLERIRAGRNGNGKKPAGRRGRGKEQELFETSGE